MPSKKQRRHKKKNAPANSCDKANPITKAVPDNDMETQQTESDEDAGVGNSSTYKVKISDILGRYIVASRDLTAGETIICEQPIVVGPCSTADAVCLGCYKPVTLDAHQYRCGNCRWPMCGETCAGFGKSAMGHGTTECEVLKTNNTGSQLKLGITVEKTRNFYEIILVLRILLMKELLPPTYAKVMCMESHLSLRKQNQELWQYYQHNIVDRLLKDFKLSDKYTDEEVHTICGILDVNCFEIGQNSAKARALYPTAFLLAHNCCPNTAHTDDPATFELKLRTSRRIRKGETLTISYAYTLQGTLKRREFIFIGKLFWCCCDRCTDPKELGTDCSALVCAKCKRGHVRSTDPLNQLADWACDRCDFKRIGKDVEGFLTAANNDLESIDVHNVKALESFMERYNSLLHENHYLLLSAKYTLCQTYGRIEGYLMQNMSLDDIKRKERYCREFLAVIDIIDPGLTRLRGLIMYELHAPLMIVSQKEISNGQIKPKEFQNKLREVMKLLRASKDIFMLEPPGSTDHEMGLAAANALEAMIASM